MVRKGDPLKIRTIPLVQTLNNREPLATTRMAAAIVLAGIQRTEANLTDLLAQEDLLRVVHLLKMEKQLQRVLRDLGRDGASVLRLRDEAEALQKSSS